MVREVSRGAKIGRPQLEARKDRGAWIVPTLGNEKNNVICGINSTGQCDPRHAGTGETRKKGLVRSAAATGVMARSCHNQQLIAQQ